MPFRRIFPKFWIRLVVVTRTHGNPLTRNLWPDLFVLLTRDVMVRPKNDSTRANNDEITSKLPELLSKPAIVALRRYVEISCSIQFHDAQHYTQVVCGIFSTSL